MKNKTVAAAAVLTLAIGATAACGGSGGSGALTAHGPTNGSTFHAGADLGRGEVLL
ncbi:MAG TPA: hypothetical protein VIJ07_15980 [Dermatophilaceae bacterium]